MNTLYIRIKDDAHFQRLTEDYAYLGWKLVRDGEYAVPVVDRKGNRNEKKRSAKKDEGSDKRPSNSEKRPNARNTNRRGNAPRKPAERS